MEKEKILLEKSKKFLQDVNRQYFENTLKSDHCVLLNSNQRVYKYTK